MKNVLIADDHRIVRLGVRMIIQKFPEQYNFIEASTCTEVVQILSSQPIHYAILDMFLADGNLFSVIPQISESSQRSSILVYSMNAERIYARRFMGKGIQGFVCKNSGIDELERAIQTIFRGEVYLGRELKDLLFSPSKTKSSENPIDTLSDRELEVVEYVAMGMGSKEIAHKMKLDNTTVSTYRRRAFEKLEAENAVELKDKFLLYKEQL